MTEVYKLEELMKQWKEEFDKPDKSELKDKFGFLDKLGMYEAGVKVGLKKAYDEINEHACWE